MAGSYRHLIGKDGGWGLIENMRDAHECVEELWWLVERAIGKDEALRLLSVEFYPMMRGEINPDASLKKVMRGMAIVKKNAK